MDGLVFIAALGILLWSTSRSVAFGADSATDAGRPRATTGRDLKMWQLYLLRARDIAADRVREAERERQVRELRRAVSQGPQRTTRRPTGYRADR
jgi:hypothetical protein